MAIFPGADQGLVKKNYTDEQILGIAICQWIMIALCLAALSWLVYNIVTILVKQKKYKVLPLLNFYILATFLIVFRIAFQVWWWVWTVKRWIFFFLLGQTLKFVIGI